ncbi:MAG: xylan 1,4-beta-xylosidase [Ruminococcus sp.]|nr:xylan 1,4-beta-xylosidase [Ruminococcus sp.]
MTEKVSIDGGAEVRFNNNVDLCVGTGRLGLALTAEYLEELKMVQEEIGFRYIRGHGLFSDDVAIYHEYEENGERRVEYNYTYIDRIFDSFLKLDIRPYLELGFMPGQMASGTQTIFYWKGNTTPPKDYKLWTDMVVALLKHLKERYGEEEVVGWPIEVWNEPNLPGFWYKADMQEYFRLFKESFLAIKAYDDRFKVGGPAICGVNDEVWIREFLLFCKENGLKPDAVTRHHYTVEFPETVGHYDYSRLQDNDERIASLQTTRDIVDSFEEFRGLPIDITEFSTSYTPKGVIHDTNKNAAYIAEQLSRLGDMNRVYSYWTFGDVFEEQGVPFTPFHGGFGMVAAGGIPKPAFYTFSFYKQLKKQGGKCVLKDRRSVVVKTGKGYAGILWNIEDGEYEREFSMPVSGSEYTLITKTVDEECCDPLKVWHDLGEPPCLDKEQTELLKSAARPLVKSAIVKSDKGSAEIKTAVRHNGVVFFTLQEREFTPDRGYDYDRVLSCK